jgi:hypothetical protein
LASVISLREGEIEVTVDSDDLLGQPGPAKTAGRGVDWTEAEVRATVDDYLAMLAAESAGQPYSKAAHRRVLIGRLNPGRTESAIEFKHQNISAAMVELGLPYIRGYLPRKNRQAALSHEIQRQVESDPALYPASTGTVSLVAPVLRAADPPDIETRVRAGRHVDYGALQEESRRVGRLGEELVVGYERDRLRGEGRPDLADAVCWAADEAGDGLGYDVLSFDVSGEILYIEVKTTALYADTPFYISSAELDFARRNAACYALYRVSNVGDGPQFFVLRGDIAGDIEMLPITYRARLRPRSLNGDSLGNEIG